MEKIVEKEGRKRKRLNVEENQKSIYWSIEDEHKDQKYQKKIRRCRKMKKKTKQIKDWRKKKIEKNIRNGERKLKDDEVNQKKKKQLERIKEYFRGKIKR